MTGQVVMNTAHDEVSGRINAFTTKNSTTLDNPMRLQLRYHRVLVV